MYRIVTVVVVCLVGAAFARGADSSLTYARRAQAELGPELWSQVIQIDSTSTAGRYPASFHALVFELADVLWFYTDSAGTESLSLRRGRVAEDKADLAPLLRAIDPGFTRWRVVTRDGLGAVAPRGELPNGCFIESLAALRVRREQGDAAADAQLLSYYVDTREGRLGHTVLTYAVDGGMEVLDPLERGRVRRFPAGFSGDALRLARALVGAAVAKARWVRVDDAPTRGGFFGGGAFAASGGLGDSNVW